MFTQLTLRNNLKKRRGSSVHLLTALYDPTQCLVYKTWDGVTKDKEKKKEKSNTKFEGGCPRGVMVKAMDSGIVVSEFVLQSCYYVHFRANTLGKGMNPLILPALG